MVFYLQWEQRCRSTGFPLMRLPPEIRTSIYSYLCLCIHKDSCAKGDPEVYEQNCRCSAQLLRLNKQVRLEILPFILNSKYLPFPSFLDTSRYGRTTDTIQFIHDLGPEKVRHIKRLSLEIWQEYSSSHIEELFKHLSIANAQIEEIHLRTTGLPALGSTERLVLPCQPLPSLRLFAVVEVCPLQGLPRLDLGSLNTGLEKKAMYEKRDLTYSTSLLHPASIVYKWEFGGRRLDGTASVITNADPLPFDFDAVFGM
ncbi:predicted protein [Sclerotinia sclerotiorum 1980 UF-70]|uniref:Uncharacterized protein n=2 Tax=Sclerotinia sclerotiorum (strain ATCC 18683 / 1980 / Ss-1) TaxID=665079 RepID=A0A1D9QA57_SCLS1|nr:predicted protein [Sclerotinia sclerotiorum 1980 UF-70]APA11788.1 hypothetical protein sscle_08g065580 [Sclerotinia sclerotiorum 1980 UF-70]EDO02810.1 predicted protein [Sclerotinia sclerotiorum 1980 UF-70]